MFLLIQVMACQNVSQDGQQNFYQQCYTKVYFLMTLSTTKNSIPVVCIHFTSRDTFMLTANEF